MSSRQLPETRLRARGTWPVERVARLRELADGSRSASEIALEMGEGLTRNAIISKCAKERLPLTNGKNNRNNGLNARVPASKPPKAIPKPSFWAGRYITPKRETPPRKAKIIHTPESEAITAWLADMDRKQTVRGR